MADTRGFSKSEGYVDLEMKSPVFRNRFKRCT